jgi:hypothetical protein
MSGTGQKWTKRIHGTIEHTNWESEIAVWST